MATGPKQRAQPNCKCGKRPSNAKPTIRSPKVNVFDCVLGPLGPYHKLLPSGNTFGSWAPQCCAPRYNEGAVSKSKSLKTDKFGTLLDVEIRKMCTTLYNRAMPKSKSLQHRISYRLSKSACRETTNLKVVVGISNSVSRGTRADFDVPQRIAGVGVREGCKSVGRRGGFEGGRQRDTFQICNIGFYCFSFWKQCTETMHGAQLPMQLAWPRRMKQLVATSTKQAMPQQRLQSTGQGGTAKNRGIKQHKLREKTLENHQGLRKVVVTLKG